MKKEKIEIFKILRYICLSVILIFGLMTIVGTGGGGGGGDGDDDPAPPSFNATGTWATEAIKMYDSDGESIGEIEQGTMTVTQTNNSITIETDDGDTFTGTVSGAIYTFSGDLGEIQEPGGQWGTATVEGTFELTSETSLFGDYTFEWTDGSHIHTEEWDFTGTKQDGCGEGLPLTISDLSFPGTVTKGLNYDGSVTYQGTYEDIANPIMFSRIPYIGGISHGIPAEAPTVSNCSMNFIGIIPVHLSGSGTIYFKLIDYDDNFDASYNWDNNSVSNELSQPITID